jgi:hypothetical protein
MPDQCIAGDIITGSLFLLAEARDNCLCRRTSQKRETPTVLVDCDRKLLRGMVDAGDNRKDVVFDVSAEICEGDKDLKLVLVACRPRIE